ncbi:MAG: hypothetical protein ACRDH1_10060, partial [Actinomycetota bacterium]
FAPESRYRFRTLFLTDFRIPLRAARRLVTRVAAVLLEEEDLVPGFFGEIFFSAIRLTPFGSRPSRAWTSGRSVLPGSVIGL